MSHSRPQLNRNLKTWTIWMRYHFSHSKMKTLDISSDWMYETASFPSIEVLLEARDRNIHSFSSVQFSSVQFSRSVVSDSLQPHELQHAKPPCPSQTPGDYSDSCPSSRWCHPAISSSVVPFSSYPQSLPASGSFPVSELFAWGGQSIGVSASASVLPVNTQYWSPSGWTGRISLWYTKNDSQKKSVPITLFSHWKNQVLAHQYSSFYSPLFWKRQPPP